MFVGTMGPYVANDAFKKYTPGQLALILWISRLLVLDHLVDSKMLVGEGILAG